MPHPFQSQTTLGAIVLVVAASCSLSTEREAPADVAMQGDIAPAAGPLNKTEVPRSAARGRAMTERTTAGGGAEAFHNLEAAPAKDSSMGNRGRPEAEKSSPPDDAPKRKVHYNGYAKLRATQPQLVLEQVVAVAEQVGGYVENLASNSATVRVPVASFRPTVEKLLTLAELVSRSVTAQDITDAYTSVELRLKTLRSSRDRLIDLLARAKTERQKLDILREIRRLTEQVDQLEMQLKTLATLASFSRITVEVEQRQTQLANARQEPIGAFGWINELSPFRKDIAMRGGRLELEAPEGMVSLDDYEHWMAEGPDGAQMWTHTRENRPEGTVEFWLETVGLRLQPAYGKSQTTDVGSFKVLELVDDGTPAYRYHIALRVDGDELEVVEIYYPSADHAERYGQAVRALLERSRS